MVRAVVDRVRAGAARSGTALSDAAARDVERTLRAAMADEGAARAVRAGVLVRPLQAPGFAGLDLSVAVAVPVGEVRGPSPLRGRSHRSVGKAGAEGGEFKRAQQVAQTALEELEQADGDVARQDAQLDAATTARQRARQYVEELRQELDSAKEDGARAATAERQARDERNAALKRARSARRKAEAAQRRLDAVV